MRPLPTGLVTLLFTDLEGSTRLLRKEGPEKYARLLSHHHHVLRKAFAEYGGIEVDNEGDAFFVAFQSAADAVQAAAAAQGALAPTPLRVRIGVHTGDPLLTAHGYVGIDVHRAARIAASAHGGQIVVSRATRAQLEPGLKLHDLGEHRLKDLEEPEWLFQFGEGEFPPLKSLSSSNLPTPATPLVGREDELRSVRQLVLNGVRLVTLTGAGGSGKTRLCVQAAVDLLEDFPNGVFFVSLASLSDASLVLPTIAQTLGVRETAGQPLLETLREHLEQKRLLLLLDNFEHLIEAATTVAELLERSPALSVLATSREPLRLSGEHEFEVAPLIETEAIELFTARAYAVLSNFEPDEHVQSICRRVDCLPLALELAAARVKLLTTEQILARLERRLELLTSGPRDLPPRHRTLRATIEWSNGLLEPDEQRLFSHLAVFVDGSTLESAQQVTHADLELLGSLVDKSLLRRRDGAAGEPRFWMLETIREFALERLVAGGDADELRARHAESFRDLAERAAPHFRRPEAAGWLERIEAENGNMRAALSWALEHSPNTALQIAAALWRFWWMRAYVGEAQGWLEQALERSEPTPSLPRQHALAGLGVMVRDQGDWPRAISVFEEALAVARQLDDPLLYAGALHNLAGALAETADPARARAALEESVALREEHGDRIGVMQGTMGLANLAADAGERRRAEELYAEALALGREVGSAEGVALTLLNLGSLVIDENPATARGYLREGIERFQELPVSGFIWFGLEELARAEARSGRAREAAILLGVAAKNTEDLVLARPPSQQEQFEATVAAVGAILSEEELRDLITEGRALDVQAALERVALHSPDR